MLKAQVKRYFDEAVKLNIEAPQELKNALLRGHPKIDAFIDNIVKEIHVAERDPRIRSGFIKQKVIQDFVYDIVKYFMLGLEGEANRRKESDLARIARDAQVDKEKEFDAVLSGEAFGEFAEAGVISNEEIDNAREATLEAHDEAIQKIKTKKA